jgi:hypothetical protein
VKFLDIQQPVDQVVAEPITLKPVGELDEAGVRWPASAHEVTFQAGDTVVVIREHLGEVLAHKNYGKPGGGLPPWLFKTDEIRQIMVEDSNS